MDRIRERLDRAVGEPAALRARADGGVRRGPSAMREALQELERARHVRSHGERARVAVPTAASLIAQVARGRAAFVARAIQSRWIT